MKKTFLFLLAIVVLAAFLRLYALGGTPTGFFRDEAALGYNTYSILKTGKDEFGMHLPIVFRSFEVYFLPAYVYLSVPLFYLFGLTEFSARLLSALSGIGSVIAIYFIAKNLWNEKVGLFAALVLAIAPWNIYYSRGAFEGNLGLAFFTFGFWAWLKFIESKKVSSFFASTILFALSMYSYQAERLVVPLFAAVAIYYSHQYLLKNFKKLIIPIGVVCLMLVPLLSLTFNPGGYHRSVGVSVFTNSTNPPGWIEARKPGFIINNSTYLRVRQIGALYLSYFSPRNLFVVGDSFKQRSIENISVFYIWTMPLLFFGLYQTIKRRTLKDKLLLAWIIIAPLPAAFTPDPFHTYRSLLLYLPLTLMIGLGLENIVNLFSGTILKKILLPIVVIVCIVSLVNFWFNYAILNFSKKGRDWDYGYKEIVTYLTTEHPGKRIVVDDPWTESYIHFLYFGDINVKDYHQAVEKLGDLASYYYSNPDEIRPEKVNNYEFRSVDWPSERGDSGSIFVMYAERLPESEFKTDPKVKLLKTIYYPNGEVAYRIVEIL